MDSIGRSLIEARTARGLSIEQAARDTHITKRFVEALEAEEFALFPAETYLLGFMRSYARYLGLDGDRLVQLYRNIQLQEQPAPIDELLERRPKRKIGRAVWRSLLVVVALGGVGYGGFRLVQWWPERATAESDAPRGEVLEAQFVEREFDLGERLIVVIDGVESFVEFAAIGDEVTINSLAGAVAMEPGEQRTLDITGEGSGDLSVAIRSLNPDQQPPTVVARVDRIVFSPGQVGRSTFTEADDEDRELFNLGRPARTERVRETLVLRTEPVPRPFAITAVFTGRTLFRIELDGEPWQERLYQTGETLNVTAQESARIWVGNAATTVVVVDGREIDLGRPGAVTAFALRWSDGGALEVLPMY